ncbi:hypothetical protein PRK78_003897 [Emydomyces testavorans]|uniref:Myb-like domain-containing protein n=1 Tax=Emydomyces testavorans TaxID=2070801 RepID=A0AAF0DHQ8_9EURO|nr:hypothetical protein PRK78_003897 [Emydomyces testavorans]
MNSRNKLLQVAGLQKPTRSSLRDIDVFEARKANDFRLQARFESIYAKYGRDFGNIGDEIDLQRGEIVVDNGHLHQMDNEWDTGNVLRDDLHPENESIDLNMGILGEATEISASPGVPMNKSHEVTEPGIPIIDHRYRAHRISPEDAHSRRCDNFSGSVSSNVEKDMLKHCFSVGEQNHWLHDHIACGNTFDKQPEDCFPAKRRKLEAIPDSNLKGQHGWGELVNDCKGIVVAHEHISSCAKHKTVLTTFPKREQPSSGQVESIWALPRKSRRLVGHHTKYRREAGKTATINSARQSRSEGNSDSDDPLQGGPKGTTLSCSPYTGKPTEAKLSRKAAKVRARASQETHLETQLYVISDSNEANTAPKCFPTDIATNPLDISGIIKKDCELSKGPRAPERHCISREAKQKAEEEPLTPEEVKCLVSLRIVEKKKWPEVLSAMPRRRATQLKHWYYKHCVGGRKELPLNTRSWTLEEEKRLLCFQSIPHASWENMQSSFPNRTLQELQRRWIQACGERNSKHNRKVPRLVVKQTIGRKAKLPEHPELGRCMNLSTSSLTESSAQAERQVASESNMIMIKSESPDPLVDGFESR